MIDRCCTRTFPVLVHGLCMPGDDSPSPIRRLNPPRALHGAYPMLGVVLLCLGACSQPQLLEPTVGGRPPTTGPALAPAIPMDTTCRRISFTYGSKGAITVTFPDRAVCTSGLVLIPAGAPTRTGGGSKDANIPVRLLNLTGNAIESPATLVLAPEDRVILAPVGGDPNKLTPQNQDSLRGASWVWLVGTSGTVAAGDSTAVRTLVVRLASPMKSAQMTFGVEVQQLTTGGWPLLINSLPLWDPTKTVARPGTNVVYFRTSASLIFNDGVSDAAKQAFFAAQGLTVLGVHLPGVFHVSFEDPGPSLEAWEAKLQALRASPEIRVVLPNWVSGVDAKIDGRFPTDGSPRQAWFSGNTFWAMQAIRAPQAWGCEVGRYPGSTSVPLGLLEFVANPQHPELSLSQPSNWTPEEDANFLADSPVQGLVSERDSLFEHATNTAGVLSASGDDGKGVAGVTWRSSLQLYSLWSTNRRVLSIPLFRRVLEEVELKGPRVLSISAGYWGQQNPLGERLGAISVLEAFLQHTLNSLPNLLIVVATGNDALRVTSTAYESDPRVNFLYAALFRLRRKPGYENRIVVVAGSAPGNLLWTSSNSFSDVTDIAAPAENVIVMDTIPENGTVPIQSKGGTSLSAPMVAGAAALLLSMDPTLTPLDLKGYLLRGAQVARFDSTTGMLVNPQLVPNATFFQLDVYGSLSLLSKERAGAPICGYPVSVNGPYVILQKDGALLPPTDSIKIPGAAQAAGYVSVAPGGRTLSAYASSDSSNGGAQAIIHFSHTGVRLGSIRDAWGGRHYAEKHIIDHRQVLGGFQEITLRQAGGAQLTQTFLQFPDGSSAGFVLPWTIDASPDGRFVAFPAGNAAGSGTYVQRFSDNSTVRVGEIGNPRWSKDGTKLVVFRSDSADVSFDFWIYSVDSTAGGGFTMQNHFGPVLSGGRAMLPYSTFSGGDAVFYTTELGPTTGEFFIAVRPATALDVKASEAMLGFRDQFHIGNLKAGTQ